MKNKPLQGAIDAFEYLYTTSWDESLCREQIENLKQFQAEYEKQVHVKPSEYLILHKNLTEKEILSDEVKNLLFAMDYSTKDMIETLKQTKERDA